MKRLNLENINNQAPYKVIQMEGYPHLFYFHTDYDVDYEISIKANDTFISSGSYALDIKYLWTKISWRYKSETDVNGYYRRIL